MNTGPICALIFFKHHLVYITLPMFSLEIILEFHTQSNHLDKENLISVACIIDIIVVRGIYKSALVA